MRRGLLHSLATLPRRRKENVQSIFTRTGQSMAFGIDGTSSDASAALAWLGAPIDLVNRHGDRSSWANLMGGIPTYFADVKGDEQQLVLSIPPMLTSGTTLAAAGEGAYRDKYRQAAQLILRYHNRPSGPIFVRTGWEQNGNWQPWAAQDATTGNQFKSMFAHFTREFRSVSPRFKIIWCPNFEQADPDLSWPGSEYVDMVGMDLYYDAASNGGDGTGYFGYAKTAGYGLDWLVAKGASAGRPICIPEWGVKASQNANVGIGNTATETSSQAAYVTLFVDWMRTNNVVWSCYWDSNADIDCYLSSGQYPLTGARFITELGAPDITTSGTQGGTEGVDLSVSLTANHSGGKWSIVGGANAALFSISGSTLSISGASMTDGNSYVVNVRYTDNRGLTDDQTITVNATAAPTLTVPGGNLLSNAEAIDNAYWSKTNLTVTANAAVGLNPGSNTAERLVETGEGFHRVVRAYTTTTGVVYRISAVVSAHSTSVRYVNLSLSQSSVTFDLQTVSVVSSSNNTGHATSSNASITAKGAGRYLIEADFTEVSGGSREVKFDLNRPLQTTYDSPYYLGDGASGVNVAAFYMIVAP